VSNIEAQWTVGGRAADASQAADFSTNSGFAVLSGVEAGGPHLFPQACLARWLPGVSSACSAAFTESM
jgi:hypothetical protein